MSGYYNLDIASITSQRSGSSKQPFPHQQDAFSALSKTLPTPIEKYAGTLLVLPTGGGKTFTAINWICRNIISKNIKVMWLAQSSYLIDQAAESSLSEAHNIYNRDVVNLRVVSSNSEHSNSGSIELTDDILICTTQTAIGAYSSEQLDGAGNVVKTPFRKFTDNCKDNQLFVVVDEAHHTPAYGCRNLLLSLREEISKLYILGLTATPMHLDKRISGWLNNIFDKWICYEADKNILQANKILSVPKYIEKDTGMEIEVDDTLYDRLANKHKDLPENIIEDLANNQNRNNLIVSDYINNRSSYGKTLIFADRWYQCEYIVEKLNKSGIRAAAVYSVATSQNQVYQSGTGRRNDEENRRIMQDFRDGKYDVVVNVRMLTEGVDVPDVKTVMITRQTTSNILLTQMIGRALRGEKAGGGKGKDYANIVFFYDKWKRILPWADVEGDMNAGKPAVQRRNPMAMVSIQLIRLLTSDIEYSGFENAEYIAFIPIGFYGCEYTIAIKDGNSEEMITYAENTIVYEFNKDKYINLLGFLMEHNLSAYADEAMPDSEIKEYSKALSDKYFDIESDNFDGMLIDNISNIVRHVSQNNASPIFIDFREREQYDLDSLAEQLLTVPAIEADIILVNKFNDHGLLWNFFYKTMDNYRDAYYKSQKRAFDKMHGSHLNPTILPVAAALDELTPEIKKQVLERDKYTCMCCGKEQRQGVSLNVDHILPVAMGGKNAVSNLQTLCKHCNISKGINEIDYRVNISPLKIPKPQLQLIPSVRSDYYENALARIINEFYHCKAVCKVNYHERKNGKYYNSWEIILFTGNNPAWLKPYESKLIKYISDEFGFNKLKQLTIKN